jgi:hypothetical protein
MGSVISFINIIETYYINSIKKELVHIYFYRLILKKLLFQLIITNLYDKSFNIFKFIKYESIY